MAYRARIKYTAAQRADIWDRWQRGESLNTIGRLFDRPSSSIFNLLAPTGGIRPPLRQRSRQALTPAEREEISRGLARRLSLRTIATQLGRSPSTISRELHRNGGATGYRAVKADQAAWDRARRPKRCKLAGHWEGDLIAGSNNSYIATLVERHTRYVMLARVPGKGTETVINALIKQARLLPKELYKSLTWDRGKEMADHQRFTLATDIKVYFCDPSSPWQRGSNENTNRLLRQYFPKGTDLSVHSQAKLNAVARRLNERPRKTLEYETPAQRFNACVASTG